MVCRALSHPDPRFPIWDRDRGPVFRGLDPEIASCLGKCRSILSLCSVSDETQAAERAPIQELSALPPDVAPAGMDANRCCRDRPALAASSYGPAAEAEIRRRDRYSTAKGLASAALLRG